MKKVKKIKFDSKTSLDDVNDEISRIASSDETEVSLDYITKIIVFLGGESLPNKGGSSVRYRHNALLKYRYYTDGIFQIHIKHKGGTKKVLKRNFKDYLLQPLTTIITELKTTQNV